MLCVALSGCSLAAKHQRAAPAVLDAYRKQLLPLDTAQWVDVPANAAWNAVVRDVHAASGVRDLDLGDRVLTSNWKYAPVDVRPGVATERRVRWKVRLIGTDSTDFRVEVAEQEVERHRGTCGDPSDWAPRPTNPTRVADHLNAVLRKLADVPPEQLSFAGGSAELLPVVAEVVTQTWGLPPTASGVAFPLQSGWREQRFAQSGLTVEVRSAVEVSIFEGGAGTSRLSVVPRLETRAVDGENTTPWRPADAGAVRRDFFARLTARVRPERVQVFEEAALSQVDPSGAEPVLPQPADPMRGTYELGVVSAVAPRGKPNGADWDPGKFFAGLLKQAPQVASLLGMTGEPTLASAAAVLKQIPPEVYEGLSTMVGSYAAPDIQVMLNLPGLGVVGTPVVKDSHLASWRGAVRFTLQREVRVPYSAWDLDWDGAELMFSGSVSLATLANACQPVCHAEANGGRLCLALRRVGD